MGLELEALALVLEWALLASALELALELALESEAPASAPEWEAQASAPASALVSALVSAPERRNQHMGHNSDTCCRSWGHGEPGMRRNQGLRKGQCFDGRHCGLRYNMKS